MEFVYEATASFTEARAMWDETYLVQAADQQAALGKLVVLCPDAVCYAITQVDIQVPYFIRSTMD